jgi:hypothetical protein
MGVADGDVKIHCHLDRGDPHPHLFALAPSVAAISNALLGG